MIAQLTEKLVKTDNGFAHWCPGCQTMHNVPSGYNRGYAFTVNIYYPGFSPSIKMYNAKAGMRSFCHYVLERGMLTFQADANHTFAGQSMILPELPIDWQDHL